MSSAKIIFVEITGPILTALGSEDFAEILTAGVISSLSVLRKQNFRLVLIASTDESRLFGTTQTLRLLERQGITFEAQIPRELKFWVKFMSTLTEDRKQIVVIGMTPESEEMSRDFGFTFVKFSDWESVNEQLKRGIRRARVHRQTNETEIEISVDLDGNKSVNIQTGLGYFDHMLEQLAKHGDFGLNVNARGDLHIDEHHTVEDTALAIGTCLREALGDKRGIGRYGFTLPMDEAESRVSLDLSGRALLNFKGDFKREAVGGLPTELVPHFFRSFSDSLGATLHIEVNGDNAHHMIESIFKGVGRALRPALALGGEANSVPSTKGTL
jgi:imidazoleglycerol-phosphate dehydratase/histidinol-phosphatase